MKQHGWARRMNAPGLPQWSHTNSIRERWVAELRDDGLHITGDDIRWQDRCIPLDEITTALAGLVGHLIRRLGAAAVGAAEGVPHPVIMFQASGIPGVDVCGEILSLDEALWLAGVLASCMERTHA